MRHGLSFKNINTYTKNVKYSLTGFLESSSVNQVGDRAKKFQASLSLFFFMTTTHQDLTRLEYQH